MKFIANPMLSPTINAKLELSKISLYTYRYWSMDNDWNYSVLVLKKVIWLFISYLSAVKLF